VNLPLFEPTYSVSRLCGEVRDFLSEAFSGVWVAGEAQRVRLSPRGHLYFELIEKGEGDEITAKLEAVIWKTDFARVQKLLQATGQTIGEGIQIRCRGSLDFYAPGGRLQLCVREVDPAFTLGHLERRRRETLAALTTAGLLDRNRSHPFPELPLTLALITSQGSAAYHDFLACLGDSGYGFRVLFLHAAVQGRDAEREIASALAALAGLPVDCAVLIRGGGAKTDLAVFDSRRIAEAIALAPFPVVTGLGHEIDRAIADRVAHTAVRTPTQAAELLIDAVARLDGRVAELERDLLRGALLPLARAREALGRAERGIGMGRLRLAGAGTRLAEIARALSRLGRAGLKGAVRREAELTGRLAGTARRRVEGAAREREALGGRLAGAARASARQTAVRIDGLARLAAQLAPERALARGFTITRDEGGRVLRRPEQVAAGDRITTSTAGGALTSRVEGRETTPGTARSGAA
jgi:exodeoxyribonuclease VII large subunit